MGDTSVLEANIHGDLNEQTLREAHYICINNQATFKETQMSSGEGEDPFCRQGQWVQKNLEAARHLSLAVYISLGVSSGLLVSWFSFPRAVANIYSPIMISSRYPRVLLVSLFWGLLQKPLLYGARYTLKQTFWDDSFNIIFFLPMPDAEKKKCFN